MDVLLLKKSVLEQIFEYLSYMRYLHFSQFFFKNAAHLKKCAPYILPPFVCYCCKAVCSAVSDLAAQSLTFCDKDVHVHLFHQSAGFFRM